MAEWQDFYRTRGNAFGILPNSQFYGPQGHRGKDFVHGAGTAIPAYASGRVVAITGSNVLGRCVVVRLDGDVGFAGWAHVKNVRVDVGDQVEPGDTLAHVAGANDSPGTAWNGAHAHTTLGPNQDSIFSGRVKDPMKLIGPAIAGATAAMIAGGVEDDMFGDADRNRMNNIWAGLFRGASVEVDPGVVKKFNYGILPIVAHNQDLIAAQSARIAALEEAVAQLASGTGVSLDQSRIDDVVDATNNARRNDNRLPVSDELDNIDGVDVIRPGEELPDQ
ncbi:MULTISPECIES: M23 family metallopeptidase [unclassified Agromyces]|uniref:M23 family metallopeptidase n=1 Tax=unclassified Agromyces TaxID=2639701 RepID=UPI0030151F79